MLKELNFLDNGITAKVEKKGLFGTKIKDICINIENIEVLEKVVENNETTSVNIHHKDDALFIEKGDYEGDLNTIYEKVMNYRKNNLFEVCQTDLTTGDPQVNIIYGANDPNN